MRRHERQALELVRVAMLSAMDEAGVTRAELARRLGITPGAVTQILSGRNLTILTFVKVLAACGLSLRFVMEPQ